MLLHALPLSIFAPASDAARRIASLGWFVTITFAIVAAVMVVLIIMAARRGGPGNLAEHASAELKTGKEWILIGGVAVPFLILAGIFISGLAVLGAFPLHKGHADEEIRIAGRQWWWEIEYRYGGTSQYVRTANELHIPVGRTVQIRLESRDVIHSFWVPRLHGKLDLLPGTRNTIRLRADKAGVYGGTCAEFCGLQHAHMRLTVVAEAPAQFTQWLRRQRSHGTPPTSALVRHGYDLFMTRACATCHTIRGTPAQAAVGPDLTHLASRRTIAAGSLPNTRANLQAWVTNAQSIKPGAQMPSLAQFNGLELNALVTYLQTLR